MSTTVRRLPEWANLLLKALFAMIFPLSFGGSNLLQLLLLPTSGLLFSPVQSYSIWLTDYTLLGAILNTVLRNFFVGIFVAFPGIYYTYKISRAPVNKSYWKYGLGAAIAIFFLTMGLMMYISMYFLSPLFAYWDESLWQFYYRLMQYPTIVMGVFIILPLVQRHAVIIGSPSALHDYSMREIESNSKLNLSREKMLSAIFWIFLCFAPFLAQINPYNWYGGYIYSGFLMNYQLGSDWLSYMDTLLINFRVSTTDFASLMIYVLMGACNFAFVRDTYRYLRKTITRQRLFYMAILSFFFPSIIAIGLNSTLIFYFYYIPIPIPLLQFAGILMVRYHRPIADQVDRVWTDEKPKMWWGKDDKEEYIGSTPEKPYRHRDEIITVPVSYLFLSKIRQLKSAIMSLKGR